MHIRLDIQVGELCANATLRAKAACAKMCVPSDDNLESSYEKYYSLHGTCSVVYFPNKKKLKYQLLPFQTRKVLLLFSIRQAAYKMSISVLIILSST